MNDDTTSEWLAQHKNAFETYGPDHWICDQLHRLIRVDLLLTVVGIEIDRRVAWPDERRGVADSYAFILRGAELTRSAIFLAVSNYQPAPFFLLRSAVNCFWFAYCAATNHHFRFESNRKSFHFYDVYDSAEKRLSQCEISIRELECITGNSIDGRSIIDDLNAFLHNAKGTSFVWERGGKYPHAFPSPVPLCEEMQRDVIMELVGHLRGLQELHRTVVEAIFVDADPEKLWSGYGNHGMRDQGEAVMRLIEKIQQMESIDLRTGTPSTR